MRTKKLTIVITCIFFSAMLVCTLFARKIHNTMIPNVTAENPFYKKFLYEYVNESGDTISDQVQCLTVNEKGITEGQMLLVIYGYKNGEKRAFAKKASITVGRLLEGYYEITEGLTISDQYIVTSDRQVNDGDEIFIVKK